MDKNVFTRDWLICTKSFDKFEKGNKYFLSITLDPDVYTASSETEEFGTVKISEEDLFANFVNENIKVEQ